MSLLFQCLCMHDLRILKTSNIGKTPGLSSLALAFLHSINFMLSDVWIGLKMNWLSFFLKKHCDEFKDEINVYITRCLTG